MAFLFITLSSNSQTINYTTGELINFSGTPTSTTSNWNNAGSVGQSLTCWQGGDPGYCGPLPRVSAWGAGSNVINYSYGLTDLNQIISIANAATAAAGGTSGVNVTGFRFSFAAKNGNGWDDGRLDQLNAYVKIYDTTNTTTLESYNYNLNQRFNWTNFSFNETFAAPRAVSTVGNAQVGFIGKDNNFWTGPYGPEIINVSFALKFSVDPCATNPAYGPNCAGFNTVLTSSNLVPNPTGVAAYGGSINNSFGIQTALQHSGTGMTVHGFDYGYKVWANPGACNTQFIICWSYDPTGYANVNVGITNASKESLYTINRSYNESGYSSNNFQYRFPSSLNQLALGSFNFTATTSGDAYVSNMYANMVYGQDPCFFNPNYSSQCTNKPTTNTAAPPPPGAIAYGSTSIDVGGVQLSTDGAISAPSALPPPPPGGPPPGSEPPPGSPPPPGAAPNPAQGPAPSNSPPAPGQPALAANQQKAGGSAPNMSLVMSTISKIQAADKATQASAVQNAQQVVATSSAAAQAQANQVVDQLNAMSAESSQSSQTITSSTMQQSSSQQQNNSSNPGALQGPITMSMQNLTASAMQSSSNTSSQYVPPTMSQFTDANVMQSQGSQGLPLQVPQQAQFVSPTMPQTVYQAPVVVSDNSSMYSLTTSTMPRPGQGITLNSQAPVVVSMVTPYMTQQKQEFKFDVRQEQEQPQSFQPQQTALSRGSVLGDILDQRLNIGSFQMEQQMDTVKKNVLPNELAGGVDITSMAVMPKGYEAYSIVTLRDVPFYKPEAIYKDNKTVDNARVLRGLTGGSDAKHQEMVNQQYKLGN